MRQFKFKPALWTAIVGLGLPALALAAPIETDSANSQNVSGTPSTGTGTYPVSSTDLLEGLLPLAGSTLNFATNDNPNGDQTGATLTNGVFGPAGKGGSAAAVVNDGTILNYKLPSTATISEIDTYSAWQDNGRSAQNYTVSVSADNITYTPLFTVNSTKGPGPQGGDNPAVKVALTDSSGGPLATGVNYIQFSFPHTENGYIGVRELDVTGTVPEPASMSLLVLSGIGLLARRRKA